MSNMKINEKMNTLYLAFRDELPDSEKQLEALDSFLSLIDRMQQTGAITADQKNELQEAMFGCTASAHEDGFYLGWRIAVSLLNNTFELNTPV